MMLVRWAHKALILCALLLAGLTAAQTAAEAAALPEDGQRLWLRYQPMDATARTALDRLAVRLAVAAPDSPMLQAALAELDHARQGFAGAPFARARNGAALEPGTLLLAHVRALPPALAAHAAPLKGQPQGSYRIVTVPAGQGHAGQGHAGQGHAGRGYAILLIANEDSGLLYGSFALLRHWQTAGAIPPAAQLHAPALPLRLLNHWDNPDGHVERGYSGRSIFNWWRLPGEVDSRLRDYARANASIGINGAVLNNVNARAHHLTDDYIARMAVLADLFRPYGIRVYLSARFSAPRDIGGLATADPLDPAVRAWWRERADAIYRAVPDFGGFLVKAASEGQPGPQDYGRSHADGANMMAEALAGRGIVMWRAFVYEPEPGSDRIAQSAQEFAPLDGRFAPGVAVQVKNGPLDFQPREPFHPLFGAMPDTPLILEAQITKEYLGFATHLAYLAPMWKEVLDADTGTGTGQTVARQIAGIAGVANTGSDRTWSGSHFDQANWFAFGRLAFDPALTSDTIAREWLAMTFNPDPAFVDPMAAMMLSSHQAVVDYMTPLGLHHLMGSGHHHGPAPWVDDLGRADWNPVYFHRADRDGIGFDRTATGSNAVAQYAPPVAARFASRATVGDDLLLWFHRVGWDERLPEGDTLWQRLARRYDRGVAATGAMRAAWAAQAGHVDAVRHAEVAASLAQQEREARWWRDASLAYWMAVSGRPLPADVVPPPHPLSHYKAVVVRDAPGN